MRLGNRRCASPARLSLSPPTTLYLRLFVSRFSLPGDYMHTVDLGVAQYLHGSALYELSEREDGTSVEVKVSMLWERIKDAYDNLKSQNRLQNLTKDMFFPKKPKKKVGFPCLKCKAAESRHLVPAMLKVCEQRTASDEDDHIRHLYLAYFHLDRMNEVVFKADPLFLDNDQATALRFNCDSFMLHYNFLASSSRSRGRRLYNMPTKFHVAWHIADYGRYLNPMAATTYAWEDLVGRIQTSGRSCAAGTSMHLITRKVMNNYVRAWSMQLRR